MGSHFKTIIRSAIILFCVSGSLLFQNCDSYYSVGQRSGESVQGFTLDTKAQTILSQNCYLCHGDTQNAGGVSHMENTNLMVQDGLIVPGSADTSPLINALESSSTNSHAVSEQSMVILRSWINSLSERFPLPDTTTPPSCTLTVDKTTLALGETVTASLQVTGRATTALIHGLPVNPRGASRLISPTVTGTIKAQVGNAAGTALCQSVSVEVTTGPVDPSTLIPRCALIASTNMAVPGDDVTLELSITGTATSATINSQAVTLTAGTYPSVVVTPLIQTTYSARVNGGGGFNTCSTTVSTKTAAQMTKREYFRAKIGSGNTSINDLLVRARRASGSTYGGSCIHCHNNTPPSGQTQAPRYFVLLSNDANRNFDAIRNIVHPTDSSRRWDLTVAPQSLYNYANGHRASASYFTHNTFSYLYRPEELQRIQTFVDKP